MRAAAHIAARLRDWPRGESWASLPTAGVSPITFPEVPLVIKAELFIDGAWIDVTSGPNGIYYETRIKIKRGRENEASRAQPSWCKIKLKNPNGWWSPRNTQGPYYGKLGRNVKLRITVNPGDGDHVRFTGFVSKWPQQWTTGDHRWVNLEANGILRRLAQGKSPLRAPLYRALVAQNPYAMWTLTETAGTSAAASSVIGGSALVPHGDLVFAGATDTPDGTNAVTVHSGRLSGSVTPAISSPTTGWVIGVAIKYISVPLAMQPFVESMITFTNSSTSFARIEFVAREADVGGFPSEWNMYDSSGTLVAGMTADPFIDAADFDDQWHYYQLSVVRTGTTLNMSAYYDSGLVSINSIVLGSANAGNITGVTINPALVDWTDLNASFQYISAISKLTSYSDVDGFRYFDSDAFFGYPGEVGPSRFARLCTEEGIDYTVVETDPDEEGMGPQGIKSLLDLLRECEATNEGVMDETTDGRLRLISRTAFYNQPPSMTIDYTSGDIKDPFIPTDDDLISRNEWVITRAGGNTREYTKIEGPLNVNSPEDDPQGIYKYDDSATLSLETDDQAYQHATWRVARGTVDEMRISVMNLHFSSSPHLLPYWVRMDMAETSRFLINSTPADMGQIPANQTMAGYSESIDKLEWTAELYGIPASVESMGVLDFFGWTDCGAAYLNEELDTTETAIDLSIEDECVFYHDEGDYNIMIRDEEVTLTAVAAAVGSGTSWTQTITVIRSVNGIVMTHPIGTQIYVSEPFIPVL